MENYKIYEHQLDQFLNSFSCNKIVKGQLHESYWLAVLECPQHFRGRFLRLFIGAKRKVVESIMDYLPQLKESETNALKLYLRPLTLDPIAFLDEAMLSMHLHLVDLAQREQSKAEGTNSSFLQLLKAVVKSMQPMLPFYFVNREYKKRVHLISPCLMNSKTKISSQKKISMQGIERNKNDLIQQYQNEELLQQIQSEVSKLTTSQLIDKYLKEEEDKVVASYEFCRVCSQKVKLKNFQKHMKNCSRKAKTQQDLKELHERRRKLYQQIQIFQKALMKKKQQLTDRESQILRILLMIKDTFQVGKKKGGLRRNTQFTGVKTEPIQEIKYELQLFQQKFQQDPLLNSLVKNKEDIIIARKRLVMVQVAFDSQIKSSRDSSIRSFKSLESSINNAMTTTNGFKTKKSLFASKAQKSKQSNKSPGSFSSISLSSSQKSIQKQRQKSSKKDTKEKDIRRSQKLPKREPSMTIKVEDFVRQVQPHRSLKDISNVNNLEEETMGLSDFQILKFLGKGAYGRVYMVRRIMTKDIYALKHINLKHTQTEKEIELIKKEHEIFKKIAGDHLIRAPFAFSETYGHFFVLQFMPGGDLSKILSEQVYLSEEQAKFYLAEIILAIEHLHKCGIIHRDLKPQNIVIDRDGHIKLTDFGLSDIKIRDKLFKAKQKLTQPHRRQPQERPTRRIALVTRCDIAKIIGTPDYIAPEIINQTSINNHSIDWWSLGVIAYEMLVGCRPFSAMTVEEVLGNIIECKIEWPQVGREEEMMSPEAYDLISRFLDKNFQRRIGSSNCQEIKKHPFFEGVDWQNIKNQTPPIIPKTDGNLKDYIDLPQDFKLRQQIINSTQRILGTTKNCLQLSNFVRYDVLLEQTYESIEQRIKKQKKKIQRIKVIGSYIEDQQKQNQMGNNFNVVKLNGKEKKDDIQQ